MKSDDFQATILQAVTAIQSGVAAIQTDITGLKTDVAGLKTDVAELKTDVRRLELLQEQTEEKIDQIIEVVSPEMVKSTANRLAITKLQRTATNHENRLRLLEKQAS